MSNEERINRFFNKVNQEYFIGKNHLMSCKTTEQVSSVCEWMAGLNDKWDNELEKITNNISLFSNKSILQKYNDLNTSLASEWNEMVSDRVKELNYEEPKYEPTYHAPIVVHGFDDGMD